LLKGGGNANPEGGVALGVLEGSAYRVLTAAVALDPNDADALTKPARQLVLRQA
jgi:hypothetical protein